MGMSKTEQMNMLLSVQRLKEISEQYIEAVRQELATGQPEIRHALVDNLLREHDRLKARVEYLGRLVRKRGQKIKGHRYQLRCHKKGAYRNSERAFQGFKTGLDLKNLLLQLEGNGKAPFVYYTNLEGVLPAVLALKSKVLPLQTTVERFLHAYSTTDGDGLVAAIQDLEFIVKGMKP